MIKQDRVAFGHSAKIISRGKIPDAGPTGTAIGHKVRPRVIGWLLFHEPE
jgi:hypothetical protein